MEEESRGECSEWDSMGHPTRSLEDRGGKNHTDYGLSAQDVSGERILSMWLRDYSWIVW